MRLPTPARLGSTTGAVCQDIDCFSRAIVGWHIASVKDTATVTTALKMTLWRRDHTNRHVEDGLIHHSDAGSQAGFNRWSQHWLAVGIVGDR